MCSPQAAKKKKIPRHWFSHMISVGLCVECEIWQHWAFLCFAASLTTVLKMEHQISAFTTSRPRSINDYSFSVTMNELRYASGKSMPLNRVCAPANTVRIVCFGRSDNIYHAFKARDSCETRANYVRTSHSADGEITVSCLSPRLYRISLAL